MESAVNLMRGKPGTVVKVTIQHIGSEAPETIEITYSAGMKPDTVKRYADLGVSRWVVAVWEHDLESCKRALGEVSDSLISLF